jgi:hypothetical protein
MSESMPGWAESSSAIGELGGHVGGGGAGAGGIGGSGAAGGGGGDVVAIPAGNLSEGTVASLQAAGFAGDPNDGREMLYGTVEEWNAVPDQARWDVDAAGPRRDPSRATGWPRI